MADQHNSVMAVQEQADGESIHRASDSSPATVQNMGVYHRGAHVGVPEQFLNRADVVAIFQQMRGEAMTHGVRGRRLGYSGLQHGFSNCLLQSSLLQ